MLLRFGGPALALLVLAAGHALDRAARRDARCSSAAVVLLRVAPIRLSKYSYLTQTGLAALVGAVVLGPSPVVAALLLGVLASDALVLRKDLRAAIVNAGREVIAFVVGVRDLCAGAPPERRPRADARFPAARRSPWWRCTSSPAARSSTSRCWSAASSSPWSGCFILRWEIVSYLVTIISAVVVCGAVRSLTPVGWFAVVALLGVLGLLTTRSSRRRSPRRT